MGKNRELSGSDGGGSLLEIEENQPFDLIHRDSMTTFGDCRQDSTKLVLAGETIDRRTSIARRWRAVGEDLVAQLGRVTTPSEMILLKQAASLAVLNERDIAAMLKGEEIDQDNYRKNVKAFTDLMVRLGLAKQSRDFRKSDYPGENPFAAALLEQH